MHCEFSAEKAARVEKLRRAAPVLATGEEYRGKYELNAKAAKQFINDHLRGVYQIEDTGDEVELSRVSVNELMSHSRHNEAHLKSIGLIPVLIKSGIFIDELRAKFNDPRFDSYRYYITGLFMGETDYTVKMVIGVKNGRKYYDHELTQIEKGHLIDSLHLLSNKVAANQMPLSTIKDTRLLDLLKLNFTPEKDADGDVVGVAGKLLAQPNAHVHLIAVSGSGMVGLAKLLLDAGVTVSGSDLKRGRQIAALEKLGLKFYLGHEARQIEGATLVGYSSAIGAANVERTAAAGKNIPQFRRAELLAALARGRRLLTVGGTHGKTTTTLMLTRISQAAGRAPGFYIGADVPDFEFSAGLGGAGGDMIVEVDESDGTLACYAPSSVLVLNIEADHLDHYADLGQVQSAFLALARKSRGATVLCADDAGCRELAKKLPLTVTYALEHDADYQAADLIVSESSSTFTVLENGGPLGALTLTLSGKHNVSNALGAVAAALSAGVSFADCQRALAGMRGAARRFEILHRDEDYLVVDDYAHHPSEIRATLAAARQAGARRVLAAFQPHRYSRTWHLQKEFAGAFADADRVLVTDIYSAGEAPIDGVSGEKFAAAVGGGAVYAPTLDDLKTALAVGMKAGDCVLTMGAGDIHSVSGSIARDLKIYRELRRRLTGSVVKLYEPMSKRTTLRAGGPAAVWVEPADDEALRRAAEFCRAENVPLTVIGRGSNLLVLDHGIRGVCAYLGQPAFGTVSVSGTEIRAGAGARLRDIVHAAKRAGLGGLEFLEGIPASLGGALRMNAGAFGGALMDVTVSVRALAPDGAIVEIPRAALAVSYRNVPLFETHIALEATLRGTVSDEATVSEILREYNARRWETQPASPSAGCTFKNPATMPAGKLIDELGLRGKKCGGAQISAVHANFIVNDGGATARDVMNLIETVKRAAREKCGVELELEVKILGY
ncbi:MAG: UDP-N-acetylmuramate--L-alanine ligase [Verrucomicrobiales bacterium]|jgi:UDP-N-acetylmuramate--L-alanine ligase/UDP-N-acetylenolpyruvoylglucosamine reductase|nr:UDP-N-acetylmuramate--L-alanine ligase [Verrucomicrobiales bacterium]